MKKRIAYRLSIQPLRRFFPWLFPLFFTLPLCGAVSLVLATDSSGNFVNDTGSAASAANSWTGDGTVTANASTGSGGNHTFVTGFSNGSLTVTPAQNPSAPGGLPNNGILQSRFGGSNGAGKAGTGAVITFVVTGGSADLTIDEESRLTFRNLSAGVTKISFQVEFSNFLSSKTNDSTVLPVPGNNSLGLGVGTTNTDDNFNTGTEIRFTYGQARVLSSDGATYQRAEDHSGQYVASSNTDGFIPDATGGTTSPIEGNQVIQGYDIDGDGSVTLAERERFYFKSISGEVEAKTGTLSGGYVFTFDGGQTFSTYEAASTATLVPEPSSFFLFLGSLGILFQRKRRSSSL